MNAYDDSPRKARILLRWLLRMLLAVLAIAFLAILFAFRGALYNRIIAYPREERAWSALRAQRMEPSLDDGWNDYQGVCHSHSELSHDSDVPFTEILRVLKETGRDFICMSDHCVDGKADYGLQWRGLKDGILFVPGFEMHEGFMPWGLPPDTILPCGEDLDMLAQQIAQAGGVLFFAHSEEERRWDLPQLAGMEIYNIHTNFKSIGYAKVMPDILINLGKYPDHVLHSIFIPQTEILRHWDDLNISRKITGIAANDCHQNNGITGTYTEEGTLLVRDTSPKTLHNYPLNAFTRLLLRLSFGKLEAGKQLFRWELDRYAQMVRFVSTHVLARDLSETALLNALKQGRAFVGFDMLADSTGFVFFAEKDAQKAVMGETIPYAPGIHLRAASPFPCRFNILRHGIPVFQVEARDLDWTPAEAGKYRLEAELALQGEWTPWVYTNPVELQ